jgi:hypothetical protein
MSEGPIVAKETLLKSHLPEGTVDLPGIGTVRIRGLSRAEVLAVAAMEPADREIRSISYGLVDPALNEDEAAAWRSNVTSDVVRILNEEVLRLSGMLVDATGETRPATEIAKRSFQEGQRS